MNWLEIKVIFEAKEPQLAADLISQLFYALDVKGVVIEDPSLQPDEAWGETAEGSSEHHAVKGFFPGGRLSQKHRHKLETGLAYLENEHGILSRMVIDRLDEADWSNAWKAHFHTEKISQHLVIKPSWQDYEARAGEIVLEIDPGMAFGTGTHPTSRLCLNLIETCLKPEDSVLDVGTGSGILMIAAAKLGARKVCGIDKDWLAVDIAKTNLKRNRIDPEKSALICGHLIEAIGGSFDLVVANILTEAVIVLLDDINKVLSKNGCFLCSGILKKNQNSVTDKLKALDFEIINIYSKEEWIAIAGKRG
jgi:ribosomal protein L11 methyltransferase